MCITFFFLYSYERKSIKKENNSFVCTNRNLLDSNKLFFNHKFYLFVKIILHIHLQLIIFYKVKLFFLNLISSYFLFEVILEIINLPFIIKQNHSFTHLKETMTHLPKNCLMRYCCIYYRIDFNSCTKQLTETINHMRFQGGCTNSEITFRIEN